MKHQIALLLTCALLATTAAADDGPPKTDQKVFQPTRHDTSPPLRSLLVPVDPSLRGEARIQLEVENRALPEFLTGKAESRTQPGTNPAVQRSPRGTSTPPVDLSVDGYSNADNAALTGSMIAPPDTNGDVGIDYYIQYLNLGWVVLNKADGTVASGPFAGNAFWAGFGGVCETTNEGDPIVLYDHIAGRWLFSQFTGISNTVQCFAISTTADPLGPYHRYEYTFAPDFNDHPTIGLWVTEPTEGGPRQNAYLMTTNDFLGSFQHISVSAFDRDRMLTGAPANMIRFSPTPASGTHFGANPVHLEGDILLPAGACGLFIQQWDDESFDTGGGPDGYQFWELCADFDTPANASLSGANLVEAGIEWDANLCGFMPCMAQPDTTQLLDTLSQYTMYRAQVRGFDLAEGAPSFRMVVNHTANVGANQAGVHWTQLDISCVASNTCVTRSPRGGGISVMQSSTWAPDGDHRAFGSIAQDQQGNIAIGYSTVSGSTFPSLRYAVQLAGDVGMGLNAEATCVAGGGSQTGSNRWHDFSSMSVDPQNGCTFWMTGEYVPVTSPLGWETRVCSFRIPSCGTESAIFVEDFETGDCAGWTTQNCP